MMFLGLFLAVLMGATLGILGGGGSILTVPLLVYVFGLEPKAAIATSLVVVGMTSVVGVLGHARKGHVDWRAAAAMGPVAMVAAYGGGRAAAYLPGKALLLLFAVMMVAVAGAMLRPRRAECGESARAPRTMKAAGAGLVVGGLTGLIGAGGGFLIVPALVLLAGLEMHVAVGTSLVLIAANAFAGLAGYAHHVAIDLQLAALVAAAAAVGSLGGASFATRVPAPRLRQGFAVFVLLAGTLMLLQRTPPSVALVGFAALVAYHLLAMMRQRRNA